MKRVAKLCLILTVSALLFTSVAVTVGAIWLEGYAKVTADVSLLDVKDVGEPAKLYACDAAHRAAPRREDYRQVGEVLAPTGRFSYVSYEEIPEALIHAFIAIEDKRFFEHRGVDLLRTGQAAIAYLKGGGRSFGGSTITQQLVKNLTERDEYTPDRKLTEIFLALDLERQVDKTEILTCYLNVINLAGGCRGVGAAATYYFDCHVSELTLAQCACLAAITNNPSVYDPIRHPENNRRRREVILGEMEKQGYITEEERQTATEEALNLRSQVPRDTQPDGGKVSSWYADMVAEDVIRDLQERLGYSRTQATRAVYGGGLKIYTAMDGELQALVEAYYADESHFPTGEGGRPQSAFLLMDPRTGDILAVAGAVGQKKGNRVQNYATDTRRPAGSVIKPLSVYAPALQEGRITWSTLYDDEPLRTEKGMPWPKNADGLYRGRVTVSEAVAHSINTVAVKMVEEVGVEHTFDFLHDRLHLTSLRRADGKGLHDMTVSSMALGQQSGGVTVREITAAYTVFDRGLYYAPVSYRRVEDRDGRVLLENKPQGEAVLSEANACVMTRMLETVVTEGSAKALTIGEQCGIAAAGKTGTTQNNCDRWFVGYTPRLLAGVWMGYDYPTEMKGIAGNPCLGIWDELMQACEAVYEGQPPQQDFAEDPDVLHISFCRDTGKIPTAACDGIAWPHLIRDGWFVRGTEPQGICDAHKHRDP